MRATTAPRNYWVQPFLVPSTVCYSTKPFSRQISFPNQQPELGFIILKGRGIYRRRFLQSTCEAVNGGGRSSRTTSLLSSSSSSSWGDKPYEVLPSGKREYLDEQDVVSYLDPPKDLIPLDPSSYNPAAYLWKKIGDIPEERRHRLLRLLIPRLISRAWEVAGTRYEDPKLAKKSASSLLPNVDGVALLEFWNCRTSGGPMRIAWINNCRKVNALSFIQAIFCSKDGKTYGRLIGGSFMAGFANPSPLYFMVAQTNEVMSTEQPCDLAYEFGDGQLDLQDYPQGFPMPGKHPWPFNDQVVIYVRHVGPGVMVGQAWQEGEALETVPLKLCGEILMVKDYAAFQENQ